MRIALRSVRFAGSHHVKGIGSFSELTTVRAGLWYLPGLACVQIIPAVPSPEPVLIPIYLVTMMTPHDEPVSTSATAVPAVGEVEAKPAPATPGRPRRANVP